MQAARPLLDEIERLSRERDRLERQQRRVRYAVTRALAMLCERPELVD
jgi:hypothetical protein